jgi:hypothetical protein
MGSVVPTGPSGLQQSWPDWQHELPQQVPVRQTIKLAHGSAWHVPPPQYGLSDVHLLPQLPQLYGSLSGLTHVVPPQHRRPIPHIVAPHAPPSEPLPDPLLDELALDPPELLPDVLPPEPLLDELPWPPLLDALDPTPELPDVPDTPLELPDPLPVVPLLVPAPEDPVDPPWLPLLDALPELCPEELPPEPPLDPPPLVDDVVPSTEASPGSAVNSAPPQRAPANTTASNAKYLRLPNFILDP